MGSRILGWSLLQKSLTRKLCNTAYSTATPYVQSCSDLITYLSSKPKNDSSQASSISPCIYRVPKNMHHVEPEAYEPNIISIGPYHYGVNQLRPMEELKLQFCRRLLDPGKENAVKVEAIIGAIKNLEPDARRCYKDSFSLSQDEFIKVMAVDSCFTIELLKGLHEDHINFRTKCLGNWMLAVLRRDLIMLENQLPLFVLDNVFTLVKDKGNAVPSGMSLRELALQFFNPLVPRNSKTPEKVTSEETNCESRHFLDLFRSSILPKTMTRGKEEEMISAMTELHKAGIKIEKGRSTGRPLDVSSEGRVLKIPPICIDDYKGTVFRNMMAFEQCHGECKPDVTSYMFFLDGLINSREDVDILQYEGVLKHSLGSNKELAKLVNNLCKEVPPDAEQSYLFKVVDDANFFCSTVYAKIRATFVHHYFQNWIVGISTLAATFALYLTLVQTGSSVAGVVENLHKKDCHFLEFIKDSILLPIFGKPGVAPDKPKEGQSSA